jgi:hypothetical protein
VDRHGLTPRDDKSGIGAKCLSLRGGRQDDAAIHRVSRESRRECGSVLEGQWIATGLRPRDDNTLCHCEEGTEVTDAAIHRVSGVAGG